MQHGNRGYSTVLNIQWRDLINTIYTDRELHINTKEFVALFINVYFAMISFLHIRKNDLLQQKIYNLDGYIFSFLCNNTAAISWMTHSSRSHDDKAITRLTHTLSHFLSTNSTLSSLLTFFLSTYQENRTHKRTPYRDQHYTRHTQHYFKPISFSKQFNL